MPLLETHLLKKFRANHAAGVLYSCASEVRGGDMDMFSALTDPRGTLAVKYDLFQPDGTSEHVDVHCAGDKVPEAQRRGKAIVFQVRCARHAQRKVGKVDKKICFGMTLRQFASITSLPLMLSRSAFRYSWSLSRWMAVLHGLG